MLRRPRSPTLFPHPPLFGYAFLRASREGDFDGLLAVLDPDVVRRADRGAGAVDLARGAENVATGASRFARDMHLEHRRGRSGDRKSTRLNSSHLVISYAVFC